MQHEPAQHDPDARLIGRVGRPAALALLGGLLATLAMPPLKHTGWLILPALVLLFTALRDTSRPGRIGWFFGLAHQATLLHWLYLLGPEATISSRGLIPVAGSSAILYATGFYLLLGWTAGRVRRGLGPAGLLLVLPVLWTGMEALRGAGELGFPWCLSGMAWLQTPLYPLAAAGGERTLGALTAATAALAVALLGAGRSDGRTRAGVIALALVTVCAWILLGRGAAGVAVAPPYAVSVGVAQPDVALADKWDKARIDSTTVPYTRLTAEAAAAGAELVVWAETAVPAYLMYDKRLLEWVRAQADTNDVFLYCGYPDAALGPDNQQWRYNGSGLFGPAGLLRDRYAKHHLLPFGERMPFQALFPFLGGLDLGQAEWRPGEPPQPMLVDADNQRLLHIAGLICYESIFPSLARGTVRAGTDVLVNITNDGWFGRTAGPVQHAEMARLRAAECGVPLVRCANNGASYVTDARGAVIERLGLGVRGVLVVDVGPGAGDTPFVRWGYRPLVWTLLGWLVLAVVLHWRRRTH
jgi:apolipoprotein N-acyltransferase